MWITGQRRKSGEFPDGPVVRNPSFHAKGPGSIPGQGTKIPKALRHSQGENGEGEEKAQGFLWPVRSSCSSRPSTQSASHWAHVREEGHHPLSDTSVHGLPVQCHLFTSLSFLDSTDLSPPHVSTDFHSQTLGLVLIWHCFT